MGVAANGPLYRLDPAVFHVKHGETWARPKLAAVERREDELGRNVIEGRQ